MNMNITNVNCSREWQAFVLEIPPRAARFRTSHHEINLLQMF